MTDMQTVIIFLEKWILGLVGKVFYLTQKLCNKMSSHLCTIIFSDEEFTTPQGRPFYFQSTVVNIQSFLLLEKII